MKAIVAVTIAMFLSNTAEAGTIWSMNGSSCRPLGVYSDWETSWTTLVGRIQQKAAAYPSAPSFICPVSIANGGTMTYLGVTVQFPIASTYGDTVQVEMYRVSMNTGMREFIGVAGPPFSSYSGHYLKYMPHTFDFGNYWYFAMVYLLNQSGYGNVNTFIGLDIRN